MVSQSRFERDYQLTVQVSTDKAVVIKPPFRISFQADKNIKTSLNKLNVKIYNLSPDHRQAIVKDADEKKVLGVELQVGYKGSIERVFKGTIHVGQNQREGANMVTTLECQDGGYDFHYSFTSKAVLNDPLSAILADMPNTTRGKITTERPVNTRPRVLVGNSYKLIGRLLDKQKYFIDDQALHVVNDTEVVSDLAPIVEAATGLINTPTREDKKVTLVTMMNPALKCAGLLDLRSSTAPHLNKVYKIEGISYDGDIDGSNWQQTVTCTVAGNYKVIA